MLVVPSSGKRGPRCTLNPLTFSGSNPAEVDNLSEKNPDHTDQGDGRGRAGYVAPSSDSTTVYSELGLVAEFSKILCKRSFLGNIRLK